MSDTYQADQDVIQGARGLRMNPAQLAALANALASSSGAAPAASPQPDANAGMGTHSAPGHNGGATGSVPAAPDATVGNGPVKTAPAPAVSLANALANAPLPPVRAANLGAPAAQSSSSADDATLGALIRAGGSSLATPPAATLPPNASAAPAQGSAIASPPPNGSATMGDLTVDTPMGSATLPAAQPALSVTPSPAMASIYAADPGAAQRAAQYAALNPTGSPVGVSPAAAQLANAMTPPAGIPGTGDGALPTPHPVGVGAIANPPGADPSASIAVAPGPMSASAAPAPTPAIQYGASDTPVPAIQYGASDRPVGPVSPLTGTGIPQNLIDSAPTTPGGLLDPYANTSIGDNLKTLGQVGGDAVVNGVSGATLGFGDKAKALAETYLPAGWGGGSSDYATNLAAQRAASQVSLGRANAGGTHAGDVEEALGTILPGGAIAKGAGAVVGGVPYVGGLLTDVGTGAALGGASAAGNDQNIGKGAMLGAGAGAIASPLAAAAGKLAGAFGNRSANSAFDAAADRAGLDAKSADAINSAIAAQGQTPQEAIRTVQGMGPGATLADSGVGTQQMTSRLAATDPAVSPLIEQNLNARNEPIVANLNDAINRAVGPDVNAAKQMADLKAQTAQVGQGYGPILSSGATVDVTPVRDMIANTRVDPIAAGVKEDPISAALGKAQDYFVGGNPSALPIKVAHQAQSAIGDMADSAARAGNNAQARALTNVRQGILQQMPPEYNAVRQQYASAKDIEDAFSEGQSLLAPRQDGQVFDPDLLQQRLAGMSQPEQQAYQLGARKAVSDVMGTARSDPAGLNAKFSNANGYAVGKLRAVFGDQPTDDLLGAMKQQGIMAQTNNLATAGSKTAMASSVNSALPNAKVIGGGHEDGFTPIYAGAELGGTLGLPGRAAGMALGAGWNTLVKPAINAAREQTAAAARSKIAAALTGAPTQDVSDALTARLAQQNGLKANPSGASAAALAKALGRAGSAYQPVTPDKLGWGVTVNPPSN
jgi:hypothetical protein